MTLDGDADVVAGGAPPSARVPLSRQLVVSAAIEFVDTSGLPQLTMHKLGELLGVEAMSLYRYVTGREDLLDAIVESVMDEMGEDPDLLRSPQYGWQDFLQRLAHGIRRMALAHPHCFPLIASRPPAAPWLRPPLRSLEWVELLLQGLLDEGFTHQAAVDAYRAFSSFLLGHLLLEVADIGAAIGPQEFLQPAATDSPDKSPDAGAATAEDYPALVELSEQLSEDNSVTEFEQSLENLLDRVARLIAPQ